MAKRRFGPYTVQTSNEDKVLFPDDGITKGDVLEYYLAVADTMLPYLEDRPLTMQRFPDGIAETGFYQKEMPDYFPDWLGRSKVRTADGTQWQVVCNNAATLAYLAQQACLTPHVWLSRRDRLDRPDRLVIDLDPPSADFGPVRMAALAARRLLAELGLPAFAMTTGSRGAHVVVPLDRSRVFDDVRRFARKFVTELARRHERDLTVEQRKAKRRGRVYLDAGNNAYGQTTVAPYAVRALTRAPVATPVDWSELEGAGIDARRWTLTSLPRRLAQRDDPWKGMARQARSLVAAEKRLDEAS